MATIITETKLPQGSQDWLEARKNLNHLKILGLVDENINFHEQGYSMTSTDAAVVMGVSKLSTHAQRWGIKKGVLAEKVVSDFSQQIMDQGHVFEPVIRAALEDETFLVFEPAFAIHENGWQIASLDGITPDGKAICEIKCPARTDSESYLKAKEGMVIDQYYAQIQHQLAVTGAEVCYYAVRDPLSGAMLTPLQVYPDASYIANLTVKELEFMQTLEDSDETVKQRTIAAAYADLKREIDEKTEQLSAIREQLIGFLGDKKSLDLMEVSLTRAKDKVKTDFAKVSESLTIPDDYLQNFIENSVNYEKAVNAYINETGLISEIVTEPYTTVSKGAVTIKVRESQQFIGFKVNNPQSVMIPMSPDIGSSDAGIFNW